MKKIKLEELSIIFNKIIEKLEFENYTEIDFSEDLYRIIPTESWSSFEKPIPIDTGSLYDDLDELKILANKSDRCTYVDFDRLSSVLRAISQNHNPPL